jgi:hypothetical protein
VKLIVTIFRAEDGVTTQKNNVIFAALRTSNLTNIIVYFVTRNMLTSPPAHDLGCRLFRLRIFYDSIFFWAFLYLFFQQGKI